MGRRITRCAAAWGGQRYAPPAAGEVVRDRHWAANARYAVCCATAFFALATLLDWESNGLTLPRAVMWAALSIVGFAVFLPPRVTAGPGWFAVRGLVRERWVHTDALVSVRRYGGIAEQLTLRDAFGVRLTLDPRVLVANPLLWHLLDTGARRSRENGTLLHGAAALRELGQRIDGEVTQAVLKASQLS